MQLIINQLYTTFALCSALCNTMCALKREILALDSYCPKKWHTSRLVHYIRKGSWDSVLKGCNPSRISVLLGRKCFHRSGRIPSDSIADLAGQNIFRFEFNTNVYLLLHHYMLFKLCRIIQSHLIKETQYWDGDHRVPNILNQITSISKKQNQNLTRWNSKENNRTRMNTRERR